MKRVIIALILAFVLSVGFGPIVTQVGAETLNIKLFSMVDKVETVKVTLMEGVAIGVMDRKGLAMCENGDIATMSCRGTFDTKEGFQGYSSLEFDDGSTLVGDEKYVYNPYYPYSEIKKILASDGAAYDWFGNSVSITGDTLLIGARGDDDNGGYSGSAYIFDRNQGGIDNWGEVEKITASDGTEADDFGYSVSVNGDTGVVGAPGGDFDKGAAYIFERHQGGIDNWGEVKKITASERDYGDNFGNSVSISGDMLVIGAYHDDNENGLLSGAAYIFERHQGGIDNWGEVKKITASERDYGDDFGYSISINSDTLVIGARRDDDNGGDTGSIYIFDRNQGGIDNWGQVKKTFASDGGVGDYFGHSVSISGNTVVVGAYRDDDNGDSSGSAYIFERNHGGSDNWGEAKKITASDGDQSLSARFGHSVSINGNTVVVGAYWDDDKAYNSGSTYVFYRNHGGSDNWGEVQKITASDSEMWDEFSYSLSISGNSVVVGAHQDNDNGNDAGSAYVYTAIYFCECDFDGDGDVDGSDLSVFAEDFGRTDCIGDCEGDFDNDGDVDGSDLAAFAADFGRTDCPAP